MNEFVEECRREWRRLRVPDPVANEMAADLTADLEEAQAEGGTPEDVLGSSAFDPRRFAAAWAVARGVVGPPIPERSSSRRPPIAIALAVLLGVLTIFGGLALLSGRASSSIAIAARRMVGGPGALRPFAPGRGGIAIPGPLGQFVGLQIGGFPLRPLALLLLIVGLVGLGLLAGLYWFPWSVRRRDQRRSGSPRWN